MLVLLKQSKKSKPDFGDFLTKENPSPLCNRNAKMITIFEFFKWTVLIAFSKFHTFLEDYVDPDQLASKKSADQGLLCELNCRYCQLGSQFSINRVDEDLF